MTQIAKSYRHQRLFDEMLERFELNARSICDAAGISEVVLSRFRNCRNDLGVDRDNGKMGHIVKLYEANGENH
jgi:hypothetical protein